MTANAPRSCSTSTSNWRCTKPATGDVQSRRWGYYALPILYGDRLAGKLDATAERATGVLWVNAVHEDVPFTATMGAAVRREIDELARLLGLEVALPA